MEAVPQQRSRVLLVEQSNGREMLKFVLERDGYTVDLADDGEAGLLTVAARHPAVALIDIDVPKLDGWTLARAIRELCGRQIALVAITSRDDPSDSWRSRVAGFDAHLVKPVHVRQVEATIRELLDHPDAGPRFAGRAR